jgi:hypothetical protein
MYLLIPGRHLLLTHFQFEYIEKLIKEGFSSFRDVHGEKIEQKEPIDTIIFAVTSANHSNTRRNPVPFYLRALAIELMSKTFEVPVLIYGIDDVGIVENFANYTVKRIQHESDGKFACQPDNTIVVCSTKVLEMYLQLGFTVLPAELEGKENWTYHTRKPADWIDLIAKKRGDALTNTSVLKNVHSASLFIWRKYGLAEKVKLLFKDEMISGDGDLTTTRDYNVYVRRMDEIAHLKFKETQPFLQAGRVGDIGCAVGSWIKLACTDENMKESDFYGIEVCRHLFEICKQRKENGEFENPYVFFAQKNAVTGLVFDPHSMNTIHTSSLTHEIESYGSRKDLIHFIKNRYQELTTSGCWINRDVVGPYEKEEEVLLWLNREDGSNENPHTNFDDKDSLSQFLQNLSTLARFFRFAKDFRKNENYQLNYSTVEKGNKTFVHLKLKEVCEFLSRKDYCDNWQSEMHETFCFWDFDEWKTHMHKAGFKIHPASHAYTNQWIVQNRWVGKAEIFNLDETVRAYPVTNMILIGMRI